MMKQIPPAIVNQARISPALKMTSKNRSTRFSVTHEFRCSIASLSCDPVTSGGGLKLRIHRERAEQGIGRLKNCSVAAILIK